MKTNVIILLALLLLTGIATLIVTKLKPNQDINAHLGIAPDFAYTTLSGEKGALYAHKGQIILLHFWATWCPPCIIEFPMLLDLAEKQNSNLVILAVTTDTSKTDIKRFYKKLGRKIPDNFITVWDADKSITQELYGSIRLPESFLVNSNMTIHEKMTGPQENWNAPVWHRKIEHLSVRKSVNK